MIRWDLLPGALAQVLLNIVLLTLVLTVFGALALKFFVRNVPLLSHAIIFFWSVFRVLIVVGALWLAIILLGVQVPSSLSGLFSLAGMCAVGWLITHDLAKRYGTSIKFPGPGFKVVLTILVLSWIFIGIYYLVFMR